MEIKPIRVRFDNITENINGRPNYIVDLLQVPSRGDELELGGFWYKVHAVTWEILTPEKMDDEAYKGCSAYAVVFLNPN